jgi:hypothetical protein
VVGDLLEVSKDPPAVSCLGPRSREEPRGLLAACGGVGWTSVQTGSVALGQIQGLVRQCGQLLIGDIQFAHAINPERFCYVTTYSAP